jgi:hypothetical protein
MRNVPLREIDCCGDWPILTALWRFIPLLVDKLLGAILMLLLTVLRKVKVSSVFTGQSILEEEEECL